MGRSTEFEYERRGLRRQINLDRQEGARSSFTRGRALESNVDAKQMKVFKYKNLRHSSGNFYFTAGYSRVGGPDVVGP